MVRLRANTGAAVGVGRVRSPGPEANGALSEIVATGAVALVRGGGGGEGITSGPRVGLCRADGCGPCCRQIVKRRRRRRRERVARRLRAHPPTLGGPLLLDAIGRRQERGALLRDFIRVDLARGFWWNRSFLRLALDGEGVLGHDVELPAQMLVAPLSHASSTHRHASSTHRGCSRHVVLLQEDILEKKTPLNLRDDPMAALG